MLTAEVSVYPLKAGNATKVINDSIEVLKDSEVNYSVNSMNTKLTGTRSEVFDSLKTMFAEAENSGGEISMVVTISNAAG